LQSACISFDLQTALVLSLRLFNLLTVSFVFFRAMTPEEVGNGLRKMGMPYGFSFILSTAMRYVPLIGRRIRLVMEAQTSRGIDLRPRIRNAANFMALLMPLLVQSFLLAEELAMAMEARGFGLKGRSFRKIYRIRPGEYVLMLVSLVFWCCFVGGKGDEHAVHQCSAFSVQAAHKTDPFVGLTQFPQIFTDCTKKPRLSPRQSRCGARYRSLGLSKGAGAAVMLRYLSMNGSIHRNLKLFLRES
jgi:hypothetical protein